MTNAFLAAGLVTLLGAGDGASAADEPARGLVEIGEAPEDAATTRLKEAVTQAFKTSQTLQLSVGKKPGTVIISFPKAVEAREHMGRTEYLYRVELRAVNGRLYERGFGSCWSDEIKTCVFNLVKLANRFAPRE